MGSTTLADRAIRWYGASARDLPWRHADTSPWGVLVSEIMLQQTPVARVTPVYEEWMDRWPTPARLAVVTMLVIFAMTGSVLIPIKTLLMNI